MFRVAGIFAIVPASVLLTVSFFVLFTLTKVHSSGLKKFGRIVVYLLWFSAVLTLLSGIISMFIPRQVRQIQIVPQAQPQNQMRR